MAPGFVIGAFVDGDLTDAESSFSFNKSFGSGEFGPLSLAGAGKLKQEWAVTAGGRFGALSLDRKALYYGLVAYTHVELDEGEIVASVSDGPFSVSMSGKLPDSFEGITFGGGVEAEVAKNVFLRLEGRYTYLDSKSMTISNSNENFYLPGTIYKDGPATVNCIPGGPDYCESIHAIVADSKTTIEIDPEIISARAVLIMKFN